VEVVLRAAQVQDEGLVEEAEASQGLLQAVDRAGGGLEDLVEVVVGGGVVGSALSDGPPLLIDRWDLSILVSAALEQILDRARIRDLARLGSAAEVERRFRTRYIPAQKLYFATARPADHADIVVHNDEPGGPPGKSGRTDQHTGPALRRASGSRQARRNHRYGVVNAPSQRPSRLLREALVAAGPQPGPVTDHRG
jgi:hypothetical protein